MCTYNNGQTIAQASQRFMKMRTDAVCVYPGVAYALSAHINEAYKDS